MAWSWSKGYTNPPQAPGSSIGPPASTPAPASTPPTGSSGGGLSGLLSGIKSSGLTGGPQNFWGGIENLFQGGAGGGSDGSGGVNTNPPGPGGEYSTPQVGPTTPPRFPGQGTPGGGLGGGSGGGFGDWLSRLRGGGDDGGGADFSNILSGFRDRFGQGGTGTPGTGQGLPMGGIMNRFGETPINGLPQGLQSVINQRWGTIGGGQPMPTTLGPFFDAAKTYYQANPPISNRSRMASFLDRD